MLAVGALSSTTLDWVSAVGTAAGALASAAAAVAAVYVGVLRVHRRRPQLRVSEALPRHVAGGRRLNKEQVEEIAWVRLSLSAEPNKDTAEDVEVMILRTREVEARDGHPPSQHDPGLEGMMLHWSSTPDTTRAHIPAGGERFVDLAKVPRKLCAPEGAGMLAIRVAEQPKDDRHYLDWGVTEIDLAVTARNMDARRYRVTIGYDGRWGPNKADIWDHLMLQSVKPISDRKRPRSRAAIGRDRRRIAR